MSISDIKTLIKWVGYRPLLFHLAVAYESLFSKATTLFTTIFVISEVVAYESFDFMSKFLECLRGRISVSVTGKYKSKVRMTCFSFHLKDCYLLLEAIAVLILLRCGSHPSEFN